MKRKGYQTMSELQAGLCVLGFLRLWIDSEPILWPEFGDGTSEYEVTIEDWTDATL